MDHSNYEILKNLCLQRKSIRQFIAKPVEQEKIHQIIAIAKTSPFASGRKNWDILVIQGQEIKNKMAALIERKSSEIQGLMVEDFKESFQNYSRNFLVFQTAPVVLVPTFRPSYSVSMMMKEQNHPKIKEWERDNFVQSISCVSMLILLAAQSLNLGSCFMTGPLMAEEELGQLLKPKPEHKLGAVIPIGYYEI